MKRTPPSLGFGPHDAPGLGGSSCALGVPSSPNTPDARLVEAAATAASLYTQSSMESALSYLFTFSRSIAPITRLQLYVRNTDPRPVTLVMALALVQGDDHPSLRLYCEVPPDAVASTEHNKAGSFADILATFAHAGELGIPQLDWQNVFDPQWDSHRAHRSFLRLPCPPLPTSHVQPNIPSGTAVSYLGFWADSPDVFTDALRHDLRQLIAPLGRQVMLFVQPSTTADATAHIVADAAPRSPIAKIGSPGPMDLIRMCNGLGAVQRKVERIAPTNSTVLILGETGVGKEVVADAIHSLSRRASGPFVKVNCGAIPDTLIDSELFGHEKGAYTGAHASRAGFFEQANTGTIFLDEIGELTPHSQVRLLRVLERREIQRVGSARNIPLDIRIIAATNRDLTERVEQGLFREDLWYRLNVFPIIIPPLRMRACDIPLLVHHFIASKAKALELSSLPAVRSHDLDVLNNHLWPGNVRELEFVVERALVNMASDAALTPSQTARLIFEPDERRKASPKRKPSPDLPSALSLPPLAQQWPTLEDLTNAYVRQVMEKTEGRIYGHSGAAELLAIHPATLRSRLAKMGELKKE